MDQAPDIPACRYLAPQGYGYDEARQLYTFGFREGVPFFWGYKQEKPGLNLANTILFLIVFGVLGLFMGAMADSLILAFLGMLGGGFLGWKIGQAADRAYAVRTSKLVRLTGSPDRKGIITDFAGQIEVDQSGLATLYRESITGNPKANQSRADEFHVSEIASIERMSYAESRPDQYATFSRSYKSSVGKRLAEENREATANAYRVILTFTNGEQIDAGWKDSGNASAVLQSDLIGFFNRVSDHLEQRRQLAANVAKIAPGDEAL